MLKNYIKLIIAIVFTSYVNGQSAWNSYTYRGKGFVCLAIDSHNNKWIGSESLLKFDGLTWSSYIPSNEQFGIDIKQIVIDSQDNKWIVSSRGLYKYDGIWTKYNPDNEFLIAVNCVVIDSQDNKWIGTRYGLYKFDGKIWTKYNINEISQIVIDSQDNKWVGTRDGLYKLDGISVTAYDTLNSDISDNNISQIVIDKEGNKWIATKQGLNKFDGTTWTIYNTSNSGISDNNISKIVIDLQGNKWIPTKQGLNKFDGTTWTIYNTSNSGISENNISQIVIDKQGNKWIGTNLKGLNKFDGTTWTIYNTSNSGINVNSISQIVIDKQGNKWILSGSSLNRLEGTGNSKICGMSLMRNQYTIKRLKQCIDSDFLVTVKNDSKYEYSWFACGPYFTGGGQFFRLSSEDLVLKTNLDSIKVKIGYIYAAVTDSFCVNRDFNNVINIDSMQYTARITKPSICMVTNQNNHNLVVWENIDNDYVSKYRIYKQNQTTSQYELVHEQSKQYNSQWLDTLSSTITNNDRYKISILDSCGNETPLSDNHSTMLLSSNMGLNGTVNLSWNPYEGFDYPTFEIWRSMDGNNFTKIGSVANNSYAYIDNNPPATAWYQIRISKQDACTPTKRVLTSVNSNIISKEGKSLGLKNMEYNAISIYPNPSNGSFTLKSTSNMIGKPLNIIDIIGRSVYAGVINATCQNLSIENIENGTYFLSVDNKEAIKLIKE
ncbi:MAG: T9SS type A sorting domain-containing protein [Crocinitomicaceae bacterium]|nr:T9SS type A sorting domain-containing protein [Crocinitomicaceae bacterium]